MHICRNCLLLHLLRKLTSQFLDWLQLPWWRWLIFSTPKSDKIPFRSLKFFEVLSEGFWTFFGLRWSVERGTKLYFCDFNRRFWGCFIVLDLASRLGKLFKAVVITLILIVTWFILHVKTSHWMHIVDEIARITNIGGVPSLGDLIFLDSYFSVKRIVLVIKKFVCPLLLYLTPSIVILGLSCDFMQYFRVVICVGKSVVLPCENLHIPRIFCLPFLIWQVQMEW